MKLSLLKKADLFLGIPLIYCARLFPFSKNHNNSVQSRILIIRPGGIGDAVILLPVIADLKRRYPHAEIDILAEKRNESIFSLSSDIRKIYCYDKQKDFFIVLKNKYDIVIDTEQWHRLSALTARIANSSICIGYATNDRSRMFTHQIPYSHDDFELDSFYHLIVPLIGDNQPNVKPPFLNVPAKESENVKSLLQPILGHNKFIVLFPGGSIKEKRWSISKFRELAEMLSRRGYFFVIIGGKEDLKSGMNIIENLPNSINFCGKLSLIESAAVLNHTALLITGDSGIMHIGYGLGTKVLALFGPSNIKKWAPRGDNVAVISKNLECSPCSKFGYTPKCKKNAECMRLITVEEVFEKAIELLER